MAIKGTREKTLAIVRQRERGNRLLVVAQHMNRLRSYNVEHADHVVGCCEDSSTRGHG